NNTLPNNSTVTINTLRPYSAWSVPITRRDPGPDGILGNADDAGTVTLYDYSAAFRGAAFVNTQIVNATNADRYDSIEGTLIKRFSIESYRTALVARSEEHTSELQSRGHLVCRLLLEKKKQINNNYKSTIL